MTQPTVTIEGTEYPIGVATAAHAEAIAPVYALIAQPEGIGLFDVAHKAGELIDAVTTITGCPRETVARQPLGEFVRIVEETAAGWIAANSDYMHDQVMPAVQDVLERARQVVDAAAEQDESEGNPPRSM